MEKLELEYNDYVSNILVFTIRNEVKQYYFSCKEEWFIDAWIYQSTSEKTDYVSQVLERLTEDIVTTKLLEEEFKRLKKEGRDFVIETHYPMLYIDFDKKILKSKYYEQSLHKRVPENWIGIYEDFLSEIPSGFRYWEIAEST